MILQRHVLLFYVSRTLCFFLTSAFIYCNSTLTQVAYAFDYVCIAEYTAKAFVK